ncbi:MAG: serine/threonine-protein kinase [Longimicrobiales bacterium]|nr:serine/threonine-protein kinase [Longimicrobiales bacterium]
MHDVRRLRDALGDRYLVEEELGRGGMATVYLAEDLRHGRRVALKVINPEMVDLLGRERFLREIQVTAKLNHPHIRPLLDSGEADGLLFFAMAVAEGATLADKLEEASTLPVMEAVRLATELAEALAHAHAHGVVHRDVKPSNVLLEAGHAVLSDFGIALTIAPPGWARITATGVTLGTAEYMSPEQCGGEGGTDPRSDIYSLGCVLHHMLAGAPPFTARSAAAVVAKQLRDPPPPLRSLRPDVPEEVQAVVLRALEKDPSHRFASADEMRQALERAVTLPQAPSPLPAFATRWAGGLMGLFVLAAAVVALRVGRPPVPTLDDSRFAVLSFVQVDSSHVSLVDGSRCQTRFRAALARWEDVELVPAVVLRDREMRHKGRPLRPDEALAIAEELGAGRLVWGQVWQEGDSTRVEANLYDVVSAAVLRTHRIAIGPGGPTAAMFDEMADSLIVGQIRSSEGRAGASGTRSLEALRLYDDGHRSLGQWALVDASRAFEAAVERDPGYAQASLWRSLVGLFQGEDHTQWRRFAAQAAREGEALTAGERLMARGLRELADGNWQDACEVFGQVVARDSLSFEGWLGLGDCQSRDSQVDEDQASPSGWRFRSSYAAAGRAYVTALSLAPSYAFALQDTTEHQLEQVFPVRVGDARLGQGGPEDTVRFLALPELRGDSLAYVPWPLVEFLQRPPSAATSQAVQSNQARLVRVTEAWLAAFPDDLDALVAHARMLEVQGLLAPTGDPTTSALDAVRAARAQIPPEELDTRVLTGTLEVRLLVKQEQFAEAARLADSLLELSPPLTEPTADALAGLAILRGRPSLAADRMASVASRVTFPLLAAQERAPVELRETALRFAAFAAGGGPLDSLEDLRRRALSQGAALVPGADRERVLTSLLSDDLALAYIVMPASPRDPAPQPGNPFAVSLAMLSNGDTAGARKALAGTEGLSAVLAAGSVPFSVAWMENHVRLALGDTVLATSQLDQLLGSLRAQDRLLVTMTQAGPLVRSMARRATLAHRAGDRDTAWRWARAVVTLWANGEVPASQVVAEMRFILSSSNP